MKKTKKKNSTKYYLLLAIVVVIFIYAAFSLGKEYATKENPSRNTISTNGFIPTGSSVTMKQSIKHLNTRMIL